MRRFTLLLILAGWLMALDFAHGAIQWNAADAATTTYTVSGLSFQPKALMFVVCGLQSATDAASSAVDRMLGCGFATSTTDRRAIAGSNNSGDGTSRDQSAYSNAACVISHHYNEGAITGALDLDALLSDGFRMIVDDACTVSLTVFWFAWGGSDLTNAETFEIAEPAAGGNVEVNLAGAFQPVVALLAGIKCTGTAPTFVGTVDTGFFWGFTTGSASAQNVVALLNSDDAAGTMDTDGYIKSGECIAQILEGGGSPNARASLASFDADGLTVNFAESTTSGRKTIGLAIKGGQWRAGSYTIDGSTLNATATVSGLPGQPIGALHLGRGSVEATADTGQTEGRLGIGGWSGLTSRRAMAVWDEDGTAAVENNTVLEYDQILAMPSNAGGVASAFDIDAINTDGFRVITDVAGGVASEFHGYLAFASNAGATDYPLDAAPGSYAVTGAVAGPVGAMRIDAQPGAVVLTGVTASLLADRLIEAATGSYALTGAEANLLADRLLAALAGSYGLTGAEAALLADRLLSGDPGAYLVTGLEADLVWSGAGAGDFPLEAAPGSYALAGLSAGALADRLLAAIPGVYPIAAGGMDYRELILLDGPVAYWRLGELTGTAIADELGVYPGTLTGAPLPTLGAAGLLVGDSNKAIQFADANNGGGAMNVAVGVVGDLAFVGVAPFCVELWLKITAYRGLNVAYLLWNAWGSTGWNIYSANGNGAITFCRIVGGVSVTTTSGALALNTLYHVIATYDGATQRLYVNAALVDSDANSGSIASGSTVQPKIGGTGPQVVTGVMDEVAIYDYALSPEQVAAHHYVGTQTGIGIDIGHPALVGAHALSGAPVGVPSHYLEPALAGVYALAGAESDLAFAKLPALAAARTLGRQLSHATRPAERSWRRPPGRTPTRRNP